MLGFLSKVLIYLYEFTTPCYCVLPVEWREGCEPKNKPGVPKGIIFEHFYSVASTEFAFLLRKTADIA